MCGIVPQPEGELKRNEYQNRNWSKSATFHELDNRTLLCSHPAVCLLLQKSSPSRVRFPELAENVVPVFPAISTVSLKKLAVSRLQIPITPGFASTDYKVQGGTFKPAVLDLRRKTTTHSVMHKRFCSTYVQLLRLQTLDSVRLLEPMTFNDINNRPSEVLLEATASLDELSDRTPGLWTSRFESRRRSVEGKCPRCQLTLWSEPWYSDVLLTNLIDDFQNEPNTERPRRFFILLSLVLPRTEASYR